LGLFGDELLSKEWEGIHENAGVLVASALESLTHVDYVAGRYLDKLLFQGRNLGGRIKQFVSAYPDRSALVARKVEEYKAYRAERKDLGIEDSAQRRRDLRLTTFRRQAWQQKGS
jgi:hypothetical protein